MNNNSLKDKFNDFNPSPQPGDWEQMEKLLEKSKFKFGFLASIIAAVIALGGLLFLYGNRLAPIIEKQEPEYTTAVTENNSSLKNNLLDESRLKGEVILSKDGESKASSANRFEKEVMIPTNKSISLAKLRSSPQRDDIKAGVVGIESRNANMAAFINENDEAPLETETDIHALSEDGNRVTINEMTILQPLIFKVENEKESIELQQRFALKKNNLKFISLSLGAFSPVVFFESASRMNLQTNVGVNFHHGNLFLGMNVGVSNLSLPSLYRNRIDTDMQYAYENGKSSGYYKSLHVDMRAGYAFRIADRINISPYLGLSGMILRRDFSNDFNESTFNPGVVNNAGENFGESERNLIFLQGGASLSYLLSARWSLQIDCSYHQSLSKEKMGILSPGLGVAYKFPL